MPLSSGSRLGSYEILSPWVREAWERSTAPDTSSWVAKLRSRSCYGFSAGAVYGPIFTAVDERFNASVLLAGGIFGDLPPEATVVNFAPRSTVPTLMINGRDDFVVSYELQQRPLFELLGAAEGQKRHARLEGGHIPPDRLAIIEEVVGWFDRHLGPVEAPGADPPVD
jgi:pimeloyl-ACP methyl ester carboxylesterase